MAITPKKNTVSNQLRKSFILINGTVILFFVVYLIQAYWLNKHYNESDQQVMRTSEVLRNIKDANTNAAQIESSVRGYLLTRDLEFYKQFNNSSANLKKEISNLYNLTLDNGIYHENVNMLSRMIDRKTAISETFVKKTFQKDTFNIHEIQSEELAKLNDSISRYMSLLENTQERLLDERTATNRYFSQSRTVFSIVSYILISLFLIVSLYKINQNIKKRSEAEERAIMNEEKYRTLVEDSGVTMLVVDNKGVIKFASKNVEELSAYSPEEFVGKPFTQCIPTEFREQVSSILSTAASRGIYNNNIELQVFTKSKISKWVSCRIFPVRKDDGWVQEWQIVIWDIDEEKKIYLELEELESERRNQQKLIQDIIDNIPSIIFIKDVQGRYLAINRRMEEVLNLPPERIIGKVDADFILDKNRHQEYKHSDEVVLSTKSLAVFEDVMQIDGKKNYFLVTKFPLLDEVGNVKNICGLATDITERKSVEIKLLQAKKEAEKAKAAQETFLANMSHEIRTPMNGIMGMTNLLMSTHLSEDQKDFTGSIQDSARNLLAIINDLLDFSKIKSGKFQFEYSPFKIRHAIKKAVYPLQFKAEDKMLKLNVVFDTMVPEVLIGDPLRLQQIIINLVGNAIKFTSSGSVDLYVACNRRNEDFIDLRINVKDTGIGIAENKLEYIFESFTQDSEDTSRKYGGTGLGLAIVKQLVELQKGNLSVKSTLGKGSVFSVTIPYKVSNDEPTEKRLNVPDKRQKNLLEGIHVLVAEDNLINQKVVKNTLTQQGAIVQLALNGRDAIQKVQSQNFDIILMDLQMPEVDGFKATRYIRQVLKIATPIVAMTADTLKGESDKCFEAGMTDFISKPFEPDELYQLIIKLTNTREGTVFTDNNKYDDMQTPLIDLSFLRDISDNDPNYIFDVLEIFMSTTPDGVNKLDHLVRTSQDYEAIYKQAHFLKSSVSIIKVRNMLENLIKLEALAKQHSPKEEMFPILDEILVTFNEALPELVAEKDKCKSTRV
ncbi:MAG: PAS domain-containing protein [Bacteroidota bacterium]